MSGLKLNSNPARKWMWRDRYKNSWSALLLENSCRVLFYGWKCWKKPFVFINHVVYNGDVLMEAENDNIGYDKRAM